MSELKLRKAVASDSQDLFDWRNDPLTRQVSLNRDEIPWVNHQKWFANKVNATDSIILIAEFPDESQGKVGMTRIDLEKTGETGEISINLNPQHRGKGLAKKILIHSIDLFTAELPKLQEITAEIVEANTASKVIFENTGFVLNSVYGNVGKYKLLISRK